MRVTSFIISSMLTTLMTFLATLSSIFRSRAALELENLALRHQIGVLRRAAAKRLKLTSADRLLWICLSRLWRGWRSALTIVKPETVIAWHRAGFRLFWTWKVRCGQPGRPIISPEVRALIRKMCRENPSWGAPRIHGELLKLGINVGESSVSKYMVRSRKPPSQTWRTFLEIHAKQLVSIDFFTVPDPNESRRSVGTAKIDSRVVRRIHEEPLCQHADDLLVYDNTRSPEWLKNILGRELNGRTKIEKDPRAAANGFTVQQLRRVIPDGLDWYFRARLAAR